ncbi:hypothetical protein MFFC18_47140 [Mariniblastus fucicola]|uniref:Uncharacterized protein n=1 Tax=Mariniblastus fucicola TaxID=980251 RepID=A0A5B9PQN3_9BACT|nr:hypothetical protein MFFC18_47140 [Mariniblastus fucicola]
MVEVLTSQLENPSGKNYLQPFKNQAIAMLRDEPPRKSQSACLYLSTTENLNQICYTAEIIRWEDKTSYLGLVASAWLGT